MPTHGEIEREMREREDEWVGHLRDLISIPSDDPPGDTRDIAAHVADLLAGRDIGHEVIAPKEDRPNVLGHFEGAADGPHLVFNGHLDTYLVDDPDAWEHDPYGGEVDDGRIYGRGAADMHGGFTASLAAFLYLYEHRDELAGEVTLAAVSDEESGGKWGAEHVVENHPEYNGDAVISGEPSSSGVVCFGEYGNAWFDVRVNGESAHSALPQGVNAIEALLDLCDDVRGLREAEYDIPEEALAHVADVPATPPGADPVVEDGRSEQYEKPSVNFGTIAGGEKINLCAGRARAEIDLRVPIGTDVPGIVDRVREFAAASPAEVEVDVVQWTPSYYSDVDHAIFEHVRGAAERVRGTVPALSYTYTLSDCRFYRAEGIPSLWYGPTSYNMGTADEYIHLDEFLDVVAVQTVAGARYLGLSDR